MERFVAEVLGQPALLDEFAGAKLPRARRGSIFVGAGDSYAAALEGFYASNGRCIAVDPYHLASAPEMADGVDVFLISVSGRTSSNLEAAKRVRRYARRTFAITADERSRLAALVDEVVALPIRYVPRTPGLATFSLSLLAVLRAAGPRQKCDFRAALDYAAKDRGAITWRRGTNYFLGNKFAYPVSLYASAKTNEFLGLKAHPEALEEFSHLEIFELEKSDSVNIFASFDPMDESGKLARELVRGGYGTRVVPGRGGTVLERVFHDVFTTQLSVLKEAADAGLTEPRFLSSGSRLGASDSMIY